MKCTRYLTLTILLASHAARAQPKLDEATFQSFYDGLIAKTIAKRKTNLAIVEAQEQDKSGPTNTKARVIARTREVNVHEPTISTATATTATELAQAAINTTVTGADAGVTLSPLALLGHESSAFQLSTTLAALKDGSFRAVAAASYQKLPEQVLELDHCKFDPRPLQDEALKVFDTYKLTCASLAALEAVPNLTPAATDTSVKDSFEEFRQACGLATSDVATVDQGAGKLAHAAGALIKVYSSAAPPSPEILPILAAVTTSSTTLAAFKFSPLECHSPTELGDAAVRSAWNTPIVRYGVSVREDRAQRMFGFNPDPKTPRSDGRLNDGEIRAEVSYARERVQLTTGFGGGESRATLTDPLVHYISPTLSFAVVVGGLTGEPLYKGDQLNVVGGALPPRLVVGVDAVVHYAVDPPATQTTHWQKVTVTAYGDFKFTDKLVFRVGVPIDGELATRKANAMATPPVTAQRDIQWTLPVFVTTVIKM